MVVRDPVCGIELDRDHTEGRSEYDGHVYYFCSRECKEMFDMDPQRYIADALRQWS